MMMAVHHAGFALLSAISQLWRMHRCYCFCQVICCFFFFPFLVSKHTTLSWFFYFLLTKQSFTSFIFINLKITKNSAMLKRFSDMLKRVWYQIYSIMELLFSVHEMVLFFHFLRLFKTIRTKLLPLICSQLSPKSRNPWRWNGTHFAPPCLGQVRLNFWLTYMSLLGSS